MDQLKHLKELEKENARLKRLVAEQALDYQTPAEFAASCNAAHVASAAGAATAFDHSPVGEREEIRSEPALSH